MFLCIFFIKKLNSIKGILFWCITINQVRTLINVISQNGFRLWGLCQVFILSTTWENFPVCSTGWEPAGSLNLLCGFVTRPLAGPIPCSPGTGLLAAHLAEPWPIGQLSHTWLLTLGFLEIVKPVYWMCFTSSCGLCISHDALPFLWGWIISSKGLILLCNLPKLWMLLLSKCCCWSPWGF